MKTNKTFNCWSLDQFKAYRPTEMEWQRIVITPEIARYLLDSTSVKNRRINDVSVRVMADDMRKGNWRCTPQGISLDSDQNIVDGQHRLAAVVKANKGIEMWVCFGASSNDIHVIDSGSSRSACAVFMINGVSNAPLVCSTVLGHLNIITGRLSVIDGGARRRSYTELIEQYGAYAVQYQEIVKAAKRIYEKNRFYTVRMIGPIMAELHIRKSYAINDIELFFNQMVLAEPSDYKMFSAINRMFINQLAGKKSAAYLKTMHIIAAWNYYRKGKDSARPIWRAQMGTIELI